MKTSARISPKSEISGPEAEPIRAELTAWWKSEIGGDLRPAAPSEGAPFEDTRGADPIAVAALVLSIPTALLAAADLAKRIELTKKIGQLIAWVRSKREQHPKLRIALVDEQGRPLDIATAKPPDVLEALGRRHAPPEGETPRKDDPGSA